MKKLILLLVVGVLSNPLVHAEEPTPSLYSEPEPALYTEPEPALYEDTKTTAYEIAPVLCTFIFFPMIIAALIGVIILVVKVIRRQVAEADKQDAEKK